MDTLQKLVNSRLLSFIIVLLGFIVSCKTGKSTIHYFEDSHGTNHENYSNELSFLKKIDTVYIKIDNNVFIKEKSVEKLNKKELNTVIYKLIENFYIDSIKIESNKRTRDFTLRTSDFLSFDDLKNNKKSIYKEINLGQISSLRHSTIDADFILRNGICETFSIVNYKKIFVLDYTIQKGKVFLRESSIFSSCQH